MLFAFAVMHRVEGQSGEDERMPSLNVSLPAPFDPTAPSTLSSRPTPHSPHTLVVSIPSRTTRQPWLGAPVPSVSVQDYLLLPSLPPPSPLLVSPLQSPPWLHHHPGLLPSFGQSLPPPRIDQNNNHQNRLPHQVTSDDLQGPISARMGRTLLSPMPSSRIRS